MTEPSCPLDSTSSRLTINFDRIHGRSKVSTIESIPNQRSRQIYHGINSINMNRSSVVQLYLRTPPKQFNGIIPHPRGGGPLMGLSKAKRSQAPQLAIFFVRIDFDFRWRLVPLRLDVGLRLRPIVVAVRLRVWRATVEPTL